MKENLVVTVLLSLAICGTVVFQPWGGRAAASLTFSDVAGSAGVSGPIDTNGSSVIDFDGDGFEDLALVGVVGSTYKLVLYHNNGNATFTDVTSQWGFDPPISGTTTFTAWADLDNDGDADLVVGTSSPNELKFYRNNRIGSGENSFTLFLTLPTTGNSYSLTAFGDYDNDGDLDVFVGFTGYSGRALLLRNNLKESGTLSFTDVSSAAGLISDDTSVQSAHWIDADDDGELDLFVVNESGHGTVTRDLFYRNKLIEIDPVTHQATHGLPVFEEVTGAIGLHTASIPSTQGIFGDYDNDGDQDLYVSEAFFTANLLYRNNLHESGLLSFSDVTGTYGVERPIDSGMLSLWGDLDNDGDIELWAGVSGVNNAPSVLYDNQFVETGSAGFKDITSSAGLGGVVAQSAVLLFDIDNNGHLDIFSGINGGGSNRLFRNNGGSGNWLELSLEGTASNREGIGARISLVAAGRRQYRQHTIYASIRAGNQSHRIHFGLGSAANVDEIEIRWPSGCVQTLRNIAANQIRTVVETCVPANTAPQPICQDVTVSAGSSCSANVSIDKGSFDPDGDSITIAQNPPEPYSLGRTLVTLTVTDNKGASSSCTATVNVVDTTPPQFTSFPADATYQCATQVPAGNPSQAQASDSCSPAVTITVADSNNGGTGSPARPLIITRKFTATDAAGNSASQMQIITVIDNTTPVMTFPAPITVTNDAGACSAVVTFSATANDNCDGAITPICSPKSGSRFNVGTTNVTCTSTDGADNASYCSFTVTVNDKEAPSIICPSNQTVECTSHAGAIATYSATAIDFCDPDPSVMCSPPSGTIFPMGLTSVACTATDHGNNRSQCGFTVRVVDTTPPTVTCAPDQAALAGTGCQALVPTFVVSASDSCGAVAVTQAPPAGTAVGLGRNAVNITATDESGNKTVCNRTFTVTNDAPVLASVTVPSGPVTLGTSASVTVSYADSAVQGHTAEFSWDDASPNTTVMAAGAASSGSITASHAYASAGVYTITVTVRDDCGAASAASIYQFIVVYDPNGGFVTGGGWIASLPGSYVADPGLTGKANFGFVSKYERGANVPTGNTEFQFQVAGFNFKSTIYEWLVVAGAKAQYKGSGKINGAGDYGFLLTAVDGDRPGGGGTDRFRIKIWDKASSRVVYDNQPGSLDDIDAANPQNLGGGSIVIHSP